MILRMVILFFSFASTFGLYAQYDKLREKYSSGLDICLEFSKKKISQGKHDVFAYYFISKIHLDKSYKSGSLSSRYSNLNQSMSYGLKFEDKSTADEKQKVEWETHLDELSKAYLDITNQLRNAGEFEKVTKLTDRYDRLIGQPAFFVSEDLVEEMKKDLPARFVNGQYFGLPTGAENVKSSNEQAEQTILSLVNKARKTMGMQALIWNEDLARSARYHAYDMCTQSYFEHNSYDKDENQKLVRVGGTFDRIKRFYKTGFANSENIAAGNSDPHDTYMQWYNSPGHYANMFNPESKYVGIGYYQSNQSVWGDYWVFCTGY